LEASLGAKQDPISSLTREKELEERLKGCSAHLARVRP
jgi:hypothetical protein